MSEESRFSETTRLVQIATEEAQHSFRQLHIWLGFGSAAGTVAVLSFVASLPDAFEFFVPSLWCYLAGQVLAGSSLVFRAKSSSARAAHFAAAHNRESMAIAIKDTVEVFASPQRIADEANAARNRAVARHARYHEEAEEDWSTQVRWDRLWALSLAGSALSFFLAMAIPLVGLSFFEWALLGA